MILIGISIELLTNTTKINIFAMFGNVFSEKWSFSDVKTFMSFMVIQKLYEKTFTPLLSYIVLTPGL